MSRRSDLIGHRRLLVRAQPCKATKAIDAIFKKKICSSCTADTTVSGIEESILSFNSIFLLNYTFEILKDSQFSNVICILS